MMLVFGAGSGAGAFALFLLWFLTRTRRHHVDLEPPVPREMIGPLFFWGSITGAVIGFVAMAVYLWWFRRMERLREESELARERARAEADLRFPD
jgi:NhaP-type Na+/H+ or K+/H+ antiporter